VILAEFLASFWRVRRRLRRSSPPAATGVGSHERHPATRLAVKRLGLAVLAQRV
jgi:hypothetical protein